MTTGLILTLVKYAFSALLTFISIACTKNIKYTISSLLELACIFLIVNALLPAARVPAIVLSDLLSLIFNAQLLVLSFGAVYITLVMLTNLDSLEDLFGKLVQYLIAIAVVLAFTFLPVSHIAGIPAFILPVIIAADIAFLVIFGAQYSPTYGLYDLIRTVVLNIRRTKLVQKLPDAKEKFARDGIDDYREKPKSLPENPNIILIFTEGLSQHMISDKRSIMPNFQSYQKRSLNFTNYYNHTYATYCALIGQLTSGYQLGNYDQSALTSLQGILKDRGYHTTVINTEPRNKLFTAYLGGMGFDEVRGSEITDLQGEAHSLSDRQAYELLFDAAMENHAKGAPHLTVIYTFGSHISFDSPDEKYGNGKDTTLNKMYNLDIQFGRFMEKFEASDMADDTIIVMTGDHCAYGDFFYRGAYPYYKRANVDCDEMPLFIHHKNVRPENVDACGRNTLCMAPTLLDYLDVSAPNYFLGTSLFGPSGKYDTIFFDATYQLTTKNGQIRELTKEELRLLEPVLMDYFAAKAKP